MSGFSPTGRTAMTKPGRSATINCLVFLGVLMLTAPSWAQTGPNIGEQIAKTYGLDGFGQIDAIRFTFNAQFLGNNISRSWVWQPKTGQISYEGKDKEGKPVKVSYVQSRLAEEPANVRDEIDPGFVNDKYNLIFPLQFYWDGAVVRDEGTQKLPLGTGSAKKVVVDYSPGDIWELYVGPDGRVVEFGFHRGGPRKPTLVNATWEDNKKAGPLLIPMERRGTADGQPLHISFSDVAVKLTGSDAWVNAQ
jgi:hypothetical protein